jgi:Zn-dependent peptidase ImmA (M78 family)
MAIEDVGSNPECLAAAIHTQLGLETGSVPVHSIAMALDIQEIRTEPLHNIEGALITTQERGVGSILVNRNSSRQRRRFTMAHELGHFLNPWHQPTSPEGFRCSRSDMIRSDLRDKDPYLRQEAEANTFAIELLAPRKQVRRYVVSAPDLERVIEMATAFDISKEASARRYVALHSDNLAVIFSKEGRVRYVCRANGFPWLTARTGDLLPALPHPDGDDMPSAIEETDPMDWLDRPKGASLSVQTLHQQNGFALTLLCVEAATEGDDDGIDDTFERFSRLTE